MVKSRANKRKAEVVDQEKGSEAAAAVKKKAAPRKKAPPKEPATSKPSSSNSTNATTSDGNARWNQMLFDLLLYKSEKGDFNVKAGENKILHQWMKIQREQYKLYSESPDAAVQLDQKQVAVLDYLQFPWVVRGAELWKRQYERLKKFRSEKGHSLASRSHLDVPGLGDWVTEQRRQYKLKMEGKTSSLTDERMNLLNELDFVWKIRERPGWDKRYAELAEFKETHGHAKVPQFYKENRQLGKWVAKQREQYRLRMLGKHSFMSPDRIQQLNALDFVWSCKGREPTAAAAAAAPANDAVKEEETTAAGEKQTADAPGKAPSSVEV